MDPFSLDGRRAVVTGASRGIGAAIARALDRAGARVLLTARSEGALADVARDLQPLGRWATPEDIADVVVFLASDASRFITGETISADGGMARTLDLYGGAV